MVRLYTSLADAPKCVDVVLLIDERELKLSSYEV